MTPVCVLLLTQDVFGRANLFMKYIPQSQYLNSEYKYIYNSLFLSNLTYGIKSAWRGRLRYKLKNNLRLKNFKTMYHIRLLFRKKHLFNHGEYYKTCAILDLRDFPGANEAPPFLSRICKAPVVRIYTSYSV